MKKLDFVACFFVGIYTASTFLLFYDMDLPCVGIPLAFVAFLSSMRLFTNGWPKELKE